MDRAREGDSGIEGGRQQERKMSASKVTMASKQGGT